MQYTNQTNVNFISNSAMLKFLRFDYTEFLNQFFAGMRGRNKNFNLKFELSVKILVEKYILISVAVFTVLKSI